MSPLDYCCVLLRRSARRTIYTFLTGRNHFLCIMKIMFVICEPAHETLHTSFPSEKSMKITKRVCKDPVMYIGRFKVKSWVILIQYSLIAYFRLCSSVKLLYSILDTQQLFMTCNFEVSKYVSRTVVRKSVHSHSLSWFFYKTCNFLQT